MINGRDFRTELLDNTRWLKSGGALLIFSSLLIALPLPFARLQSHGLTPIGLYLASIILFIQAIRFWRRKPLGFVLHILAALLYTAIAYVYLKELTELYLLVFLALGILYFMMGIFRIYTAASQGINYLGWEWTFFCGLLNLFLILVLLFFPYSPYEIILTVVCLDIFFTGIALMKLGISADQNLKL